MLLLVCRDMETLTAQKNPMNRNTMENFSLTGHWVILKEVNPGVKPVYVSSVAKLGLNGVLVSSTKGLPRGARPTNAISVAKPSG